jgi:phospholipase C
MDKRIIYRTITIATMCLVLRSAAALAGSNLNKVNHIIIVMQENHSFDNYFGALAYDPNSPYHNGNGTCVQNDHACVDGLTCTSGAGGLSCSNSNFEADATVVSAFHDARRCVVPDLDHEWVGAHYEANFTNPNESLQSPLNDGFVRQNDRSSFGQQDPPETQTPVPDDDTMGFYNQADIPFYYSLAESFAIDDRYFSPAPGPTVTNRFYLMAATSFGHLDFREMIMFGPGQCSVLGCPVPYKPITGTIFQLLDQFNVSWTDYYSDGPESISFVSLSKLATHAKSISQFYIDAATAGGLPPVSFVEAFEGVTGTATENDEHPPTDIQRGQQFVSEVVNAVRHGPNWSDSIVFITYDESGGFYDHVAPPLARQGGFLTPDGIGPGQCADLSNPPASERLGGGADCPFSTADAQEICPSMSPSQPFPASCATFNQYGFRVPFIAVSPFSKPHYVSHTVGDHTSILALIEKRFFRIEKEAPARQQTFLTKRDENANTLEDMFDFDHSPSLKTAVPRVTTLPVNDCTPLGGISTTSRPRYRPGLSQQRLFAVANP